MTQVICIVEGDGEVAALPVLLRRLAAWRSPDAQIDVPYPIRVRRDRFLNRQDEFSRYLQLASSKCNDGDWVLLLLDADDDCPATLASQILARAQQLLLRRPISVVLANREYEAWFIGAAASLNGHRGLTVSATDLAIAPEIPRNAKGWLSERMSRGSYGETTDQPAFSAQMDLQQALDRCRSFRKLCAEWDRQIAVG